MSSSNRHDRKETTQTRYNSLKQLRICPVCKKKFAPFRNKMYCSEECRRELTVGKSGFTDIPTGTVGAIQEYRVCIDLLAKGFEVFRAVSPSCSCDLLIQKNKRLQSVEVKTAYKNKLGTITHPTKNIKAEILALVIQTGEIIYQPNVT